MNAQPTIREAYRTDHCVVYRVFPAGSNDEFAAIEVRDETAYGDQRRITCSHSSNRFSDADEAMAQGQALLAAAELMAKLQRNHQ